MTDPIPPDPQIIKSNPVLKKNKKQFDQTKIVQKEQEIADLKDKLARSLADYANLEKRVDSQRQLVSTLIIASIMDKLLVVLDDFYRSYQHLNDAGLKMAIDKFVSVLKSNGVEEIEALGQHFDPVLMDCIEAKEGDQDIVLEVKTKGYKLNGQIIRPAKVVVGKQTEIKN